MIWQRPNILAAFETNYTISGEKLKSVSTLFTPFKKLGKK